MRFPRKVRVWLLLALVAAGGSGLWARSGSVPASRAQLVVLDTDIGDDLDDAFALALVLRSPELKLLGVTTEYGETGLRARLADRFLKSAGYPEIPVAAGVPTPHTNVFTQAVYARHWPKRRYPDAAGFLLAQIRAHPGRITLIAIGPAFNLRQAIARDPRTYRQLKRVVMMGGSLDRGYDDSQTAAHRPPEPEWNVARNPAALQMLLRSGVPVYLFPLDSTQVRLKEAGRERVFSHGSPLTDQLTLLYHQWRATSEWRSATPILFDPVAVAYAIRPDLCPTEPARIEVDDSGMTKRVPGKANAEVCLRSDEDGFLDLLLERLTGKE